MIKNKNILITGGNSGIGFFAIINLLKTKNILYVVVKNEFRKNEFLKKIEKYFDKNYLRKTGSYPVASTTNLAEKVLPSFVVTVLLYFSKYILFAKP